MKQTTYTLIAFIALALLAYTLGGSGTDSAPATTPDVPKDVISVPWNGLGAELVRSGVIDGVAFHSLYEGRGGLTSYERSLLSNSSVSALHITRENAGVALNLLWAFGLSNQNPVLTEGPMVDPRYGGPGGFASTGGWTLSVGNTMDHYAAHRFITLSKVEQELVERVSRNVYRPCCNNSTYFPDCNHGMAMLGLLELMASAGAPEAELYRTALAVNKLWFPGQYQTIGSYLGDSEALEHPATILGSDYSSASGYQRVLKLSENGQGAGSSCGV